MKYLILLCLFFSTQADAFFFEEDDKNLHVAVSMAATFTLTSVLLLETKMSSRKAALVAFASVMLVGIAKEAINDDKFDYNDVLANSLGAGMATIPFIVVDF